METSAATTVFAALSQETRLKAFRLLVQAGPEGLPAGVISDQLGIPHNTLSFHLNHLTQASIATSRRQGRSVIYSVDFDTISAFMEFLLRDCCTRSPTHKRLQEPLT